VDCEKFDRIVLDLLYEELDELTTAAAERHMEHCSRCRGIGSGLRATREIGALPLVEPPGGLEARILAAERSVRAELPLRQRLGRSISVLAGYAMRPQLAMAALLLLMIGSSLLFLRARPGARESVRVTERGAPEAENETVTVVPLPARARAGEPETEARPAPAAEREAKREKSAAAPEDEGFAAPPAAGAAEADNDRGERKAQTGATSGDDQYDRAMEDYRSGRYAEAQKNFDGVATRGGGNAPSAELFAAQAVRNQSGCAAAAPRFEAINSRHRGTGIGNEAAWQAGDCYRALGQGENARRNYQQLVGVSGYDDRAQRALAALDEPLAAKTAAKSDSPAAPKPAAPGAGKKAAPKAKPAQNQGQNQNQNPPSATE